MSVLRILRKRSKVSKEEKRGHSRWYSFHCVNYGKYLGTSNYHVCSRCRNGDFMHGCGCFVYRKKKREIGTD